MNKVNLSAVEPALTVLGFGLLVVLLGHVQLEIPNALGVKSNLTEIAIILSLPFLRHWFMAVLVSLFTAFCVAPDGVIFPETVNHIVGILFLYWFYQKSLLITNKVFFVLAWCVAISAYYYVFVLPVFSIAHYFLGVSFDEAIKAYLSAVKGSIMEVVATTLVSVCFHLMISEYRSRLKAEKRTTKLSVELEAHFKKLQTTAYVDSSSSLPNDLQLEKDIEDLLADSPETKLVLVGFEVVELDSIYHHFGLSGIKEHVAKMATLFADSAATFTVENPQFKIKGAKTLYHIEENTFVFLLNCDKKNELEAYLQRIPFASVIDKVLLKSGVVRHQLAYHGAFVKLPDDANTPQQLMHHLLNLLHKHSDSDRNRFISFDQAKHLGLVRYTALNDSIIKSIRRDDFYFEYQPQFDVTTKKVVSFEALMRWDHLQLGLISPSEFIPLAESVKVIDKLTLRTIDHVIEFIRRMRLHLATVPRVYINLSPSLLTMEFLIRLKNKVEQANSGAQLGFEITENTMSHIDPSVHVVLAEIRALGVRFSIDKFGTGYSNLAFLQSFEFDTIKVDKSFITQIDQNEKSQNLVRSIITLARSFGMTPIAEGAENQRQLDIVTECGCNIIQCDYFSPPLLEEDALNLLSAHDAHVDMAQSDRHQNSLISLNNRSLASATRV